MRSVEAVAWEALGLSGATEVTDSRYRSLANLIRSRDAEVAAGAWDEGYAVATDDFLHSDYCGARCRCGGMAGMTNPYKETS